MEEERDKKIKEATEAALAKLSDSYIKGMFETGSAYFGQNLDASELDHRISNQHLKTIGEIFSKYNKDPAVRDPRTQGEIESHGILRDSARQRLKKILKEETNKDIKNLNDRLKSQTTEPLEDRLSRAEKLGFDTKNTYYHGTATPTEFKAFKKTRGEGPVYFSPDPEYVSKNYGTIEGNENIDDTEFLKERIIPVHLKLKDTFNPENLEHIERIADAYVRNNAYDIIHQLKDSDPSLEYFDQNLLEDKSFLERLIKENPEIVNDMKQRIKDQFLRDPKKINYSFLDDHHHTIKAAGFDSVISPDLGDNVDGIRVNNIGVYDPKNIRSKFADFDPAKVDSSDISSFTQTKKPDFLGKMFGAADIYGAYEDIKEGRLTPAAISAAEYIAPKLGAFGKRVAPYLDLLRPTEMMTTKEQAMEDERMTPEDQVLKEKARFSKIKNNLKD